MPKKILIITKDVGEFNVYYPIVKKLMKEGVEVAIVAEALSQQKWIDAGLMIICGAEVESDQACLVRSIRPEMILTGLGAPINLGEKFGLVANQLGIKLGFVHDLWGVNKRSSAFPQFVCVTDEYDAKLVQGYPQYARELGDADDRLTQLQFGMPKIYITGSSAMDSLAEVEPDKLVSSMTECAFPILVLGQDEATTPMLEILSQALSSMHDVQDYTVIPRLHPKFMGNTDLRNAWLTALYGMKSKVLFVEGKVTTRELMLSVPITLSVYSTGLIEAAMLGSVATSVISDVGRQKMNESLGVKQFPLVGLGCAKEISTPDELVSMLRDPFALEEFSRVARERLQSDGKATERVVEAILQELG